MAQDNAKASDGISLTVGDGPADPADADHLRFLDDEIDAAEQRVKDATAHLDALKTQKKERS